MKKSKITYSESPMKTDLVAFRVNPKLSRLLNQYQSKSEVITEALEMYFDQYEICSKCRGTGKIKRN